jgi:hypothetical protein
MRRDAAWLIHAAMRFVDGEGGYEERSPMSMDICPSGKRIGLDFGESLGYKRSQEQGAPVLAEKIPFEPDLGNASVGNGDYYILCDPQQGHILR